MPTDRVYYRPLDLSLLTPGQRVRQIDGPPMLESMGANDRFIHTTHAPNLFCCTIGGEPSGSVMPLTAAKTAAASGAPDDLARFVIMGNATRRALRIKVLTMVDSGTGTLKVTHGGVTVTETVTNTSPAAHTIDITPTSGSAPAELLIQGYTAGTERLFLISATGQFHVADRTTGGADAAGYIPLGDNAASTTGSLVEDGAPLTTEWVSRGWNNMRAIARDRVACLATLQNPNNELAGRASWNWNGSTPQMAGLLMVPVTSENFDRNIRISVYAVTSAAGVEGKVWVGAGAGTVAGHSINVTSTGAWSHIGAVLPASRPAQGSMCLPIVFSAQWNTGSTSGYTNLLAAQVLKEP